MRKFRIFFLLLVALSSSSSLAEERAPLAQLKKNSSLVLSYDDMLNVTWVLPKNFNSNSQQNSFQLYFGILDSGQVSPIHLFISFADKDWLFIKRIWGKADGLRFDLSPINSRPEKWKTEVRDGGIREWIDVEISDLLDISTIKNISNSKSVIIRLQGNNYSKDKNLSENELKLMQNIISAYEVSTGSPW